MSFELLFLFCLTLPRERLYIPYIWNENVRVENNMAASGARGRRPRRGPDKKQVDCKMAPEGHLVTSEHTERQTSLLCLSIKLIVKRPCHGRPDLRLCPKTFSGNVNKTRQFDPLSTLLLR